MACSQTFTHHEGPYVTINTIPQTVLFPDLFDKPLVATFDRRHASSDGGAVLLKAAERVYGLVAGFARCLVDRREPGRSGTRWRSCSASGSSALPAVIPMATTPTTSPTTRSTSCCSGGTRWRGRRWPRSRRSRGSRTALAGPPSTSWRASWRCGSSSGISAGWTGGRGASRSTWIRPTTRRTAPSSSPSSTGTTIAGATCRCWRF